MGPFPGGTQVAMGMQHVVQQPQIPSQPPLNAQMLAQRQRELYSFQHRQRQLLQQKVLLMRQGLGAPGAVAAPGPGATGTVGAPRLQKGPPQVQQSQQFLFPPGYSSLPANPTTYPALETKLGGRGPQAAGGAVLAGVQGPFGAQQGLFQQFGVTGVVQQTEPSFLPVGELSPGSPLLSPINSNSQNPLLSPINSNPQNPLLSPINSNPQNPLLSPITSNSQNPLLSPINSTSQNLLLSPINSNSQNPLVSQAPPPNPPGWQQAGMGSSLFTGSGQAAAQGFGQQGLYNNMSITVSMGGASGPTGSLAPMGPPVAMGNSNLGNISSICTDQQVQQVQVFADVQCTVNLVGGDTYLGQPGALPTPQKAPPPCPAPSGPPQKSLLQQLLTE